jgi:hypothetical protein
MQPEDFVFERSIAAGRDVGACMQQRRLDVLASPVLRTPPPFTPALD